MEERRPEGLDPRELETHRAWLLRLAHAILRDADQAEDCVQDVFLTALRGGPAPRPERSAVRAWLKRVLVNRARKSIDREAQRRYHETVSLGERPRGAAGEPLELLELQAELHRGVLALDPRYREVVLLRHERGLTPSEIAGGMGVPVKTVNSWLYRAYGKLRERLDGRYEGYRGWAPLVLGLARGKELAPAAAEPAPHGRAAGTRWLAASALVAAAGSAAWLSSAERDTRAAEVPAATPEPEVAAATLDSAPLTAPAVAAAPARTARTELDSSTSLPGAAEPAPPVAEWRGRVVDAAGAPVGGARIRFEPLTADDVLLFQDRAASGFEELMERVGRAFEPIAADSPTASAGTEEAVSDPAGSFALPAPGRVGWLAVGGGEWCVATTSVALVLPPAGDALVRVAPARRVAGVVRDQDGLPLASVRVELRQPERFLAAEPGTQSTLAHEPSAYTDDDGAFAFERAPDVDDATLRFHLNGYEPAERRLGACKGGARAIEVELVAEDAELVVSGRALDPLGEPVAGAFLSFDWQSTATSDERGRFRLRLPAERAAGGARAGGTLRAAAQGFQPLSRALRGDSGRWPEVELVFEHEALELTGVVLRADGTPHSNAAVWVPNPSPLGIPPGERQPIFAEHVMGGTQDGGSLQATITDAEGRFRLRGLQERPYLLRVADLETREWLESGPYHGGEEGLVLELPPDGVHAEVRGVVRGRDGAPLAGARIARSYPRLDAPLPDGRRFQTRFAGETVEADAEGRFALSNVAKRGGILTVFGPGIETRHVELEREPRPTELELVVGRTCRVVVERGGADFDRFAFANAQRGRVDFQPAVQGAAVSLSQAPLAGARSAEFLVSDLATELVLLQGSSEVARVPIELAPGETNVLAP